jgi:enoyl-CoA hydratase
MGHARIRGQRCGSLTVNQMATVETERRDFIWIVTINRPEVRNAVDRATAAALADAFRRFESDEALRVAVLTGAGGTFCAGADLKAVASGHLNALDESGDGPMGPTRMLLSKPTVAAVEGYAVAGGLELALWCDLRVVARNATLGVYCRRFGIPLMDLGTTRLPRLIGQSHALDLILTGRGVSGEEALAMGLANRLTESGRAFEGGLELARLIASFPQKSMRSDRLCCYEQWELSTAEAMRKEFRRGVEVLASGESREGARRFAAREIP